MIEGEKTKRRKKHRFLTQDIALQIKNIIAGVADSSDSDCHPQCLLLREKNTSRHCGNGKFLTQEIAMQIRNIMKRVTLPLNSDCD